MLHLTMISVRRCIIPSTVTRAFAQASTLWRRQDIGTGDTNQQNLRNKCRLLLPQDDPFFIVAMLPFSLCATLLLTRLSTVVHILRTNHRVQPAKTIEFGKYPPMANSHRAVSGLGVACKPLRSPSEPQEGGFYTPPIDRRCAYDIQRARITNSE